jgi:hypothetical protein
MKSKQAKELVNYLSKARKISSALNLNRIIDRLEESARGPHGNFNTFEFSFVYPENNIRLLHINFYKSHTPIKLSAALKFRMDSLMDIFKYANHRLKLKYDLETLRDTFLLAEDILCPIQFGCEVNMSAAPIMKEYFSVIDSEDCLHLLKKVCLLLGLNFQKLEKEFVSALPLDTIGIDFLPNGRRNLKIYPYYQQPFNLSDIRKAYQRYRSSNDQFLEPFMAWIRQIPLRHIGFLCRVSKDSEIDSVKIWTRMEKSIPCDLLPPCKSLKSDRLQNWLNDSKNIIKSFELMISYLTLENNNLGIYFR